MPIASSPLVSSKFGYATGAAGTVTVPAGASVSLITCYSSAGGTLTITPGGAGQTGAAGGAIVIPAGASFTRDWPNGGPLGGGTVLAFAATDTYYVEYATAGAGT